MCLTRIYSLQNDEELHPGRPLSADSPVRRSHRAKNPVEGRVLGGRPYFTPEFKSERNQQIWQLYNDGSTLSDIGNAVSLSKRRVEDILAQLRRQYGATQRRYKPLSDRNQAILDLYEQGMPAGEIAATIHVRREIVKKTINYYVPDPDL